MLCGVVTMLSSLGFRRVLYVKILRRLLLMCQSVHNFEYLFVRELQINPESPYMVGSFV